MQDADRKGSNQKKTLLYFFLPWSRTPYSQMAVIQLSFYIYVNKPSLPRLHFENSEEILKTTGKKELICNKAK